MVQVIGSGKPFFYKGLLDQPGILEIGFARYKKKSVLAMIGREWVLNHEVVKPDIQLVRTTVRTGSHNFPRRRTPVHIIISVGSHQFTYFAK